MLEPRWASSAAATTFFEKRYRLRKRLSRKTCIAETMTSERETSSCSSVLAWHALFLMLIVAVLAGIGFAPTQRLGGPGAVTGMLAGCGISTAAGLCGMAVVLLLAGRRTAVQPADRLAVTVAPMALRFVLAVLAGMGAALAGVGEPKSLLVWLSISYMALLPVETSFAIRVLGAMRSETS